MSFGQYTRTGERLAYERGAGYREPAKDGGFPVPREQVRSGRMKNEEIMAGVRGLRWVSEKRTAHNEVTRTYANGNQIVRLREADIAIAFSNGDVALDTGGWNTVTTRAHMMDLLSRHGYPSLGVYGAKGRAEGRNVLVTRHPDTGERLETRFERRILLRPGLPPKADIAQD